MKKVNKTVTFTTDTQEQNLLKKVEQELSQRKYDSFSILCKKALQVFLSNPESPSTPNNQLEQTLSQFQVQLTEIKEALEITEGQNLDNHLTGLTQKVEQIDGKTEQQMTQLQEQMSELKQVLSKPSNDQEKSQLNVNDWLEKMEQTNTNFHQQLEQLQQQITHLTQTVSNWKVGEIAALKQSLDSVNAEVESNELGELTESQKSEKPPSKSEELLVHFRPLLDDF